MPTENNVINKLNSLLIEGIELQRELIIKDRKSLFFSYVNILNNKRAVGNWVSKVTNILKKNYPEPQYYGYFIKEPKEVKVVKDLLWPLSVLIPDLNSYLEALEEIIRRIEEKENKILRKDLTENDEVLYKITFSENTRIILFNNAKLAHPNSDSKAMNFFEYVYKKPNTKIAVKNIEEASAKDLSNNIDDILRDLHFVRSLRKIFFPLATKENVYFRNPITKNDIVKDNLPIIDLLHLTRTSEK